MLLSPQDLLGSKSVNSLYITFVKVVVVISRLTHFFATSVTLSG